MQGKKMTANAVLSEFYGKIFLLEEGVAMYQVAALYSLGILKKIPKELKKQVKSLPVGSGVCAVFLGSHFLLMRDKQKNKKKNKKRKNVKS